MRGTALRPTHLSWLTALATLLLLIAPTSTLAKTIKTKVFIPAAFDFNVLTDGCTNNPGPQITIGGNLILGELNGAIRFQNPPGNHSATRDAVLALTIIDPTDPIIFPKQGSAENGVTGNPEVLIQFFSGNKPLTGEISLGKCNQLDPSAALFGLPADLVMDFSSASCSNHPGPTVTLSGELTLGTLDATLILRNNNNNPRHGATKDVKVALQILAETPIEVPKKGVVRDDGATGNPLLFFLVGEDGQHGEFFLGRCVQLSK